MSDPLIWLALIAGVLAAFNPCGVALFPGYLTMLAEAGGRTSQPALTGVGAGVAMSVGFSAVFGLLGLLLRQLDGALFQLSPILSLAVAAALLVAGLGALLGWLRPLRPAAWLGRGRGGGHLAWRLLGYGVVYALVSISCSLPVFLAISAQALAQGGNWPLVAMVLYALGMGLTMTVVAVLTLAARQLVAPLLALALPRVHQIGGAVFLLSGLYLAWYWLLGPEQLVR